MQEIIKIKKSAGGKDIVSARELQTLDAVSYTHLTLPTNREV